ncbi:MAG: DEAD/DEAH box helicase [Muribaculum sp.]|nr:DEAD/DEAH box helicase [Muribaculum sp.]
MAKQSTSFALLDTRVQHWIWKQGWNSLKDIQENTIPVVLEGKKDVIVSASTAGGKTEAVFFPILTSILRNGQSIGYSVLYISPLKALINDQYQRLSDMTSDMEIDVFPWHGDIDTSKKNHSIKNPNGILIITPESLESFLINRKRFVKSVFSSLQYVIIDELHYFIGTERGKQLQSLMARIEYIVHKHIPRVAMSATFSDYECVKHFLRNDGSLPCVIPPQGESNYEIKVLVKEHISSEIGNVITTISDDIYSNLRGSNNLIFTNSRIDAEEYAMSLSDLCMRNGVPDEFRVHHGSIAKINRDIIERDLQKGHFPITVVCTSTLELGVDIGKVKSIAQIGKATSISGLRQRLGRSGRRNEPSILRIYSIDKKDEGILYDLIHNLIQNIAVIELMREHKYEQPSIDKYHFSTLVQQIIALIAQFGGFYAKEGYMMLCQNGAFRNITPEMFLSLLKCLGKGEVLSQLNSGQIVTGSLGEKILKTPDFYVAFASPKDYIVIDKVNSKYIGMIQCVPNVGETIILSGKRWIVESFDESTQNIYVSGIISGGITMFMCNEGIDIDSIIVKKMREIYGSDTMYPYLDRRTDTENHLLQSRLFFQKNSMAEKYFVNYGNVHYFFTWAGTKVNRTIVLLAQYYLKKQCYFTDLYVKDLTLPEINTLIQIGKVNEIELSASLPRKCKIIQKYDYLLTDKLLDIEYSKTYLDLEAAYDLMQRVCSNEKFQL